MCRQFDSVPGHTLISAFRALRLRSKAIGTSPTVYLNTSADDRTTVILRQYVVGGNPPL